MQVPLNGGVAQPVLECLKSTISMRATAFAECIFSSDANETLEFYEFDSESGKSSLMFKIADSECLSTTGHFRRTRITAFAKKLRHGRSGDISCRCAAARREDRAEAMAQRAFD